MKLLLCFLPDDARPDAESVWRACIQWGPIVHATTRRGAIRSAIEQWLRERQDEPVNSLQVKAVRAQVTIQQVEHPATIAILNRRRG